MRAYTASQEESLRARDLLKDWAGEGFLTPEQYRLMEQETVCDLRRTNIFLWLVLLLFTAIIVVAAAGLFFTLFFSHPATQTIGIFLLIFAGVTYAAAEFAVSRFRLHRYGIEEALLACSVGFLCGALQAIFEPHPPESLIASAGIIASLWIWYRFRLPYAPVAAMIFVLGLPTHWTASPSAYHLIVAAIFAAGAFLGECSIPEALVWLGIYLVLNLKLPLNLFESLFGTHPVEFPRTFYWTTWVLTWCLPPIILARGVRRKSRLIIAAGAIAAVITLVTNKLYLGWPRHTWDPMLLGALLIAVALYVRRRLAASPGAFTAKRLPAVLGLVTFPQPAHSDFQFGGGDAGGGGASSNF